MHKAERTKSAVSTSLPELQRHHCNCQVNSNCGYILFFKLSNKKRKVVLPGYKLNYPHKPGFFLPLE